MKQFTTSLIICCFSLQAAAQTTSVDVYDLLKKFIPDSTGYESVGDWAVGSPKKYPVKWKEDRVIMSDDTSINFYRTGIADLKIKNQRITKAGQPAVWNVMLKGPRMGFTSFSIISSPGDELKPGFNIDSLFGKKPFKAKLLKRCDDKPITGFYYYELKLPGKDLSFLKISWLSVNGNTALRIDCYDNWTKYAVKLNCPQ